MSRRGERKREREKEREKERDREREKEMERERVCVCVEMWYSESLEVDKQRAHRSNLDRKGDLVGAVAAVVAPNWL